jgi:broad specificity phosphatase PhoE
MSMPKKLVLIRHGESEVNIIQKLAKKDKAYVYPKEYMETPDREVRLSKLGREQTKKTGEYLKQNFPDGFDIIFVSDHTRAKETAALVCLAAGWDKCKIKVDPQLGERNWGNFHKQDAESRAKFFKSKKRDPLHTPLADGETLLEARHRTRVLLDRCARQFSGKRVLVFTHGEYIECIWSEIGHMRTEEQVEFFAGAGGDIKNCQVVEFISEEGKFAKVRSSNPHLEEIGTWLDIDKKTFSPQELLEEVNKYSHMVKE